MSKVSTLSVEIQNRLLSGDAPESIARALSIPRYWVYATQELLDSQYQIECSDPDVATIAEFDQLPDH